LAQETQIDVLLKKMLHILIEVSAAKKCYLILKDDGWKIEAFLDTQGGESILKGIELNPNILSIDLINYVIRTKTGITSDKLKSEIRDPYILQKKPKSTLVLLILNQSEIVAVIYLEHCELENIFYRRKTGNDNTVIVANGYFTGQCKIIPHSGRKGQATHRRTGSC